jgi:Lon protease-like protein
LIPIFPLPNVVLFPGVCLPLHIFEPRYRDMTRDTLARDRIIGMVLLRDGGAGDVDGDPPVYDIGCSGLITHSELLPDGRYNIVLRGIEKFRILDEDHTRRYRRASVTALPEPAINQTDDRLRVERNRLEPLLGLGLSADGSQTKVPQGLPDGELVNALAQYLEFEAVEKQALLQRDGPVDRCRALIDLLEMRSLSTVQTFTVGGIQ